jgi:hypothetical protein
MTMTPWNVRVMRRGQSVHIGRVAESTETLARMCRAVKRYRSVRAKRRLPPARSVRRRVPSAPKKTAVISPGP